ncbi:hypothetical protein QYM36_003764 [Artemia franciscana]|uniref:Uncharacterized protein n=1 Tax=Artemia franciscana TaxID=6661 RepID=A0AA88I4C6_ARTSF|nr:hypothetical protein QYM36_003764 [Artemia franciscana]
MVGFLCSQRATLALQRKCMYLAGLVPEPMTADDDFKLIRYGIGFTNMVMRATKGSADLTRREIREGKKSKK